MTKLFEGLEQGDLKRLVKDEIHIDEFKSKLGKDEDVCVISFKVRGKEPAEDLINFIEKGYDWVIDADVSSGEMDDGDYIVFIECERNEHIAANTVKMMNDIINITDQKLGQWRVRYHTDVTEYPFSVSTLKKLIPHNAEEYKKRFPKDDNRSGSGDSGSGSGDDELETMKATARVKTKKKAPKNEYTESLRAAAGLI
jgi:hypothetical protein